MTKRNWTFCWMWLKKRSFFIEWDSKSCFFWDSKNWTFLKKITHRNETFLWLKELNFFQKKNFFKYDSQNWTFVLYDSKNWTFFWYDSKNWTLFYDSTNWTIFPYDSQIFFLNTTHRNEPFFFGYDQRIELFLFWYESENWHLFLISLNKFNSFCWYDSKNWTLFYW